MYIDDVEGRVSPSYGLSLEGRSDRTLRIDAANRYEDEDAYRCLPELGVHAVNSVAASDRRRTDGHVPPSNELQYHRPVDLRTLSGRRNGFFQSSSSTADGDFKRQKLLFRRNEFHGQCVTPHICSRPTHAVSGNAGRRLLQTPVDAAFAELPVSDLGRIVTTCTTCQMICENVEDLRSLSGLMQLHASLEAALVSECQNGVSANASDEHSHCQPVCSTIPSESCDLYPDDCRCETADDEGTAKTIRHARQSIPSCCAPRCTLRQRHGSRSTPVAGDLGGCGTR